MTQLIFGRGEREAPHSPTHLPSHQSTHPLAHQPIYRFRPPLILLYFGSWLQQHSPFPRQHADTPPSSVSVSVLAPRVFQRGWTDSLKKKFKDGRVVPLAPRLGEAGNPQGNRYSRVLLLLLLQTVVVVAWCSMTKCNSFCSNFFKRNAIIALGGRKYIEL